jgi:hypothetical protein
MRRQRRASLYDVLGTHRSGARPINRDHDVDSVLCLPVFTVRNTKNNQGSEGKLVESQEPHGIIFLFLPVEMVICAGG